MGIATLLALVVTACAGESGGPASATDPSAGDATTPAPIEAPTVAERCGAGPDVAIEQIASPEGASRLLVATWGEGPTSVLVLHQTTGDGLCGSVSYGDWLAGQGLQVSAMDLCGYGQSTCDETLSAAPAEQVKLVVDHLRASGGGDVALVGASLGGSVAMTAGPKVGASRVVALSPPNRWEGLLRDTEATAAMSAPWVLVTAKADRGVNADDWKAAGSSNADGEVIVVPGSDHGWSLVTDGRLTDPTVSTLGKSIASWVKGAKGATVEP